MRLTTGVEPQALAVRSPRSWPVDGRPKRPGESSPKEALAPETRMPGVAEASVAVTGAEATGPLLVIVASTL